MALAERPVLVAPDSFKGTFRAAEVARRDRPRARARRAHAARPLPARRRRRGDDGGAAARRSAARPSRRDVHDPLGRPHRAAFALVEDGGTAVLEMAAASGLGLVAEAERDAWAASTYGTGELICAAVDAGARGDPGRRRRLGHDRRRRGRARGDRGARRPRRRAHRRADATCARRSSAPRRCSGRRRAPTRRSSRGWRRGSTSSPRRLPRDPRGVPMTGAAGGLSGGLWAAHGATLEPGRALDPRRARASTRGCAPRAPS